MDTDPQTKPPKEIDSGFGSYETPPEKDREPIPHTKPTILFDQETVRVLNWEALSN